MNLFDVLGRQLDAIVSGETVSEQVLAAGLERYALCAKDLRIKYFESGVPDWRHTDQWAMFLYCLSTVADEPLRTDLYRLNKSLHALDIFPDVVLPTSFLLSHPVGTVVGRAHFEGPVALHQSCTIGGSVSMEYPSLGAGVVLFAGSMVLGPTTIGNNVFVAPGTIVVSAQVPSDCIVFGRSPNLVFRETNRSVIDEVFLGLVP